MPGIVPDDRLHQTGPVRSPRRRDAANRSSRMPTTLRRARATPPAATWWPWGARSASSIATPLSPSARLRSADADSESEGSERVERGSRRFETRDGGGDPECGEVDATARPVHPTLDPFEQRHEAVQLLRQVADGIERPQGRGRQAEQRLGEVETVSGSEGCIHPSIMGRMSAGCPAAARAGDRPRTEPIRPAPSSMAGAAPRGRAGGPGAWWRHAPRRSTVARSRRPPSPPRRARPAARRRRAARPPARRRIEHGAGHRRVVEVRRGEAVPGEHDGEPRQREADPHLVQTRV